MSGRPLDTSSANVNNSSVNQSGKMQASGLRTNPGLSTNSKTKGVVSGKGSLNASPSGFGNDVTGTPVKGVKNGGANGTGNFC